jgi:hypothetical protein
MAAEMLKSGNVPSLVTNVEVFQLLQPKVAERRQKAEEEAAEREEQAQAASMLLGEGGEEMGGVGGGGDEAANNEHDPNFLELGSDAWQQRHRTYQIQKKLRHRDWIEDKVHDYLTFTPCYSYIDKVSKELPQLVRKLKLPTKKEVDQDTRNRRMDNEYNKYDNGHGDGDDNDVEEDTDENNKKVQDTKKNRNKHNNNKKNNKTERDYGYGLTDGEALQILNVMPSEPVELHLVVQDVTSRLSEEQQTELLESLESYRPLPYVATTEEDVDEEFMIED